MTIGRNYTYHREVLTDSSQTFTSSWVDLGDEIEMMGWNKLGIWITLSASLGIDMCIRAVAKLDKSGDNEYYLPIRTVGASDIAIEDHYFIFTDDISRNYLLEVTTDCLVPYIQFQIRDSSGDGGAKFISSAVTCSEITKILDRRDP